MAALRANGQRHNYTNPPILNARTRFVHKLFRPKCRLPPARNPAAQKIFLCPVFSNSFSLNKPLLPRPRLFFSAASKFLEIPSARNNSRSRMRSHRLFHQFFSTRQKNRTAIMQPPTIPVARNRLFRRPRRHDGPQFFFRFSTSSQPLIHLRPNQLVFQQIRRRLRPDPPAAPRMFVHAGRPSNASPVPHRRTDSTAGLVPTCSSVPRRFSLVVPEFNIRPSPKPAD